MYLFDNKFGRNPIEVSQCKLKDNIFELLILVQNWRKPRGFFSNTHICEWVSLDVEVTPQVVNGMFVINCNYTFLLSSPLKTISIYWLYQWNVDSTSFLDLRLFSKSPLGYGPKHCLVSGESQCICSTIWFDLFSFCFINISIWCFCLFCWF